MKLSARVERVLVSGIHRVAVDRHHNELIFESLPLPDYVEIEGDEEEDAMMYRYQDDGTFCGDTWHASIQEAKQQAVYEFGIPETAWKTVG